ncbi:threonine/serine exporter family protein [Loigolactobacillus zhaoyuanensis]|uniref:Threonine/serine exporter family protein n=1 Tax=Loigolactobacillus zhaoyuanensis TaxID=2486017 RepID=A0ABW8UAX5_9LACO|nr:threonine/serine exporter family protein [Loigolactobacillus zhaoyuanensis]
MWLQLLLQIGFSYLATIAFGICTNVPRRALNACGITGVAGWLVYWGLLQFKLGHMLPNLVGAFVIALVSLFFARRDKIPVIIFNIPSLVPLVPGGIAYRGVRAFVLGHYTQGLGFAVQVLMISGSIAVGFMLAQFVSAPHQLLKRRD